MIDFLRQRLMSFKWAFKGFFDLFNSHPNAQIHLLATTVVVPAIFFFRLSSIETCLIVLCVAFVLSMEALNSALEYLSDFVSSEEDALIGKAKDIAAAAVLIAAIAATLVAGIIFIPKITAWYLSF